MIQYVKISIDMRIANQAPGASNAAGEFRSVAGAGYTPYPMRTHRNGILFLIVEAN
jgi:hypothetical protein